LKPDLALNVCTGGRRGRRAAGPAGDHRHPLHAFSGRAGFCLGHAEGHRQTLLRAAGVPVPDGLVRHRREAAKRHLLPPPYVVKPLRKAPAWVFIVREDMRLRRRN